jgi:hypothetical protein
MSSNAHNIYTNAHTPGSYVYGMNAAEVDTIYLQEQTLCMMKNSSNCSGLAD